MTSNLLPLPISLVVCKDGSCGDVFACYSSRIGHVVGPSCTEGFSCDGARISSADRSCTTGYSCENSRFLNVDFINSCNANKACQRAQLSDAQVTELIDCCNDEDEQCRLLIGANAIYRDGCVSYMYLLLIASFAK